MTKTVPELHPLLEQEVQNLLEKGAICEVPFCEDSFYSRLFVTPKRDGNMRPIIELSPLNRFIDTPHFQMENLATVKSLLRHRSGIEPDVSLNKIYVRDFKELASAFVRFARVRFARVRSLASDLLASDLLASDLLAPDLLASDLLASDLLASISRVTDLT